MFVHTRQSFLPVEANEKQVSSKAMTRFLVIVCWARHCQRLFYSTKPVRMSQSSFLGLFDTSFQGLFNVSHEDKFNTITLIKDFRNLYIFFSTYLV